MKKYFLFFIFITVGLLLCVPVMAQEVINDFTATIKINKDASIDVIEKISYDFGAEQRRGIYRDIPVKYKARGGNYKLRVSGITVTDDSGRPYIFKILREGDNKRVKIGEANKYVTGVNKYVIAYTVKRAINYFEDHDELYWNVTGNEWPVIIKQSRAKVILPARVRGDDAQAECFSGAYGSTNHCISDRYVYSGADMVNGFVFTDDRLKPGEGLTVVAGWPNGIVEKPSTLAMAMEILRDNWILGAPFVVFLFLFYLWRARGRDPMGRGTVIAQFEPLDGLTPAEVGTIIDETAHKKDLSAEIINLAVKGYIKITRLEKDGLFFKSTDYLLEKLREEDGLVNEHEKKLLNGLFEKNNIGTTIKDLKKAFKGGGLKEDSLAFRALMGVAKLNPKIIKEETIEQNASRNFVKLSSLKNTFYKDLEEVKKKVYGAVLNKGYFTKHPNKVRGIYAGIGAGIMFLAWFSGPIFGFLGVISVAVSGILTVIFGYFMPAKTKKGVLAKEHILGLKLYLTVAEKDRLKFHNAPQKNPKNFEKLLPYAMVLGVEKEWAKQFEGIYRGEPSWYHDSAGRGFTAFALAQSLDGFQAKANSTLASRPSSASGGSSGFSGGGSGGGFGGGGGGSW